MRAKCPPWLKALFDRPRPSISPVVLRLIENKYGFQNKDHPND